MKIIVHIVHRIGPSAAVDVAMSIARKVQPARHILAVVGDPGAATYDRSVGMQALAFGLEPMFIDAHSPLLQQADAVIVYRDDDIKVELDVTHIDYLICGNFKPIGANIMAVPYAASIADSTQIKGLVYVAGPMVNSAELSRTAGETAPYTLTILIDPEHKYPAAAILELLTSLGVSSKKGKLRIMLVDPCDGSPEVDSRVKVCASLGVQIIRVPWIKSFSAEVVANTDSVVLLSDPAHTGSISNIPILRHMAAGKAVVIPWNAGTGLPGNTCDSYADLSSCKSLLTRLEKEPKRRKQLGLKAMTFAAQYDEEIQLNAWSALIQNTTRSKM